MKIYLAARYSRHPEMQEVARSLQEHGHEVTSRWIWGDHQIDDQGLSAEAKAEERQRFAQEDLADLLGAEVCVSFTETPRTTNSRGGRHVEHGIAIGAGKRLIIVGPRENVFHCLPGIDVVAGAAELPALLAPAEPPKAQIIDLMEALKASLAASPRGGRG